MMTAYLIVGLPLLALMFGGAPSAPPPPPAPPPLDPEIDLEELARKRRDIQNRRRGVSKLRIDPASPGDNQASTGIRIPNG